MEHIAPHTEPQRLRALEHANTIRLARAELKRRIAGGDISAAEVILDCPAAAARWTVGDLLMAQRRWGVTRCRKFLERNGINELKPIAALTPRQRRLLATQLQARPGADGLRADHVTAAIATTTALPVRECVFA